MSARSFILLADGAQWRVAAVSAPGEVEWIDRSIDGAAAVEIVAEEISEALSRAGYRGGGVSLLIDSANCLAASISTVDLPRQDRRSLIYRLEEKLPLSAEEVVADFAIGDGRALGVAVRTE